MTYSIYNRGHLLASYTAHDEACGALVEIALEDPANADLLALVAVDASGQVSTGYSVNSSGQIAEKPVREHA
jgi:hypothetical protein